MIFTDGKHLVASTVERLHEFAHQIGLHKRYFREHPRHPHYILLKSKRKEAQKHGAVTVGTQTLVEYCKIMYPGHVYIKSRIPSTPLLRLPNLFSLSKSA